MNAEIISWSIAVELALPFIVLSFVLVVMMMSAKKKNKQAVRRLILKIKNNEERQKENVIGFLIDKLAIEDKKAKSSAKKIMNERKFLFRNLISGILDKNVEALAGLEDDLSRISDHYHQLDVVLEQVAPPSEAEIEEQKSIDEFKQEVKMLKQEVHVTLTTLNNIFGEFSSMFGEEVPDTEMSVDQIITAMEAFSSKSDIEETEISTAAEVEDEPESELDELDAFSEPEDEEEDNLIDDSSDLDILEEVPEELNELEELEELDELDQLDELEQLEEPEELVEDDVADESVVDEPVVEEAAEDNTEEDELDFSIDSELDDIDSALDELELGQSPSSDDEEEEPSWGDAFEESGDIMEDDAEKD